MCTLLPVSGGYIHYAGRFLDPSARFAAGCRLYSGLILNTRTDAVDNTILGGISFVCFELTGKSLGLDTCSVRRLTSSAMHVVLQYWHPDLNPAITISCGLAGLALANGISVRVYGEIEFWISILKVILMLGLFLFTFITMVGGNPIGDRYGFR
jgi:amino acid transporter